MILAGDIGGTKTRLSLFSSAGGPRAPIDSRTYASRDHDSLEAILEIFTADCGRPFSRAVFAVAGPVIDGRVEVTNLPWVIEAAALRRQLGIERVALMNDLQAAAYALPFLEPSERLTLNAGQLSPGGTQAVIAPGTGLGGAFLVPGAAGFEAYPSEGGHTSFAPRGRLQVRLLQYLSEQFDHVSYERVCSGIGIPLLYRFLKADGAAKVSGRIDARVAAAGDPTPVIIGAALERPSEAPLCVLTVHTFVDILAAAAGNLALQVAAVGGVYVGGGIPPRITGLLRPERFMAAFTAKGRMAGMLQRIPVHLITRQEVTLFGAACHALPVDRSPGEA